MQVIYSLYFPMWPPLTHELCRGFTAFSLYSNFLKDFIYLFERKWVWAVGEGGRRRRRLPTEQWTWCGAQAQDPLWCESNVLSRRLTDWVTHTPHIPKLSNLVYSLFWGREKCQELLVLHFTDITCLEYISLQIFIPFSKLYSVINYYT